MSTKKLILLVLVAGGLVGLYYAGAPPVAEQPAPDSGLRATLAAAPARLRHGAGKVGSKIVAPAVRKMVANTERDLELLRLDLRSGRGTPVGLSRAREGVKRVAAMDSSAMANLSAGRPVQAFKDAMQASGLVSAVQDNLRAD